MSLMMCMLLSLLGHLKLNHLLVLLLSQFRKIGKMNDLLLMYPSARGYLMIGYVKMSHTLPPLEELKRRAYCKFHNTFSHATNDCNVLRRQIQSAINEGRLVIPQMQVDQNPFPAHTHVLELSNPKVLIRPNQAESTKGKNIIIGEERSE